MFNIEEELAKYNLTQEKYENLLQDCSNKVQHISDDDWSEICVRYGLEFNPDTIRKGSQPPLIGSAFVSEYYKWKESQRNSDNKEDSYFKELQIQKDAVYKEKRKLYDQRREYNKLLTVDARAEHLNDELVKAAQSLNEEKPLYENVEKIITVNTKKEALLAFSDWHFGMVTDNTWNTYNTEICRERIAKTVAYTKRYLELNHIDHLSVIHLGDIAHGVCHVSCRVQSEEDFCDQLMHSAELLAESLNELSKSVNHVTFYSCYGNHLRSVQNKNDAVDSDNLEKIVPWWLEQRLQKNSKINIQYSEYKEFTLIPILGYNICCTHGNLDTFKNLGVTVNTLFSRKFNKTISYTISGDKHHLEEFEQFDIESILVRSLCGTDDYANDKRLYSKAGQTLMIFNDEYGREATYHIPLN